MLSVNRAGVDLYYEEVEGYAAPMLFVHGWCCDHTYFAPQFDHFASRGHRVVSVDLRGHGESDAPDQAYTMDVFADDLAWLCDRLEVDRPVVVGHSMGGIVAFDLAARYPGLASAIVMLDSAIVLPSATRAAIPAFLERLRGPDYRSALGGFAENALFLPTDDPARRREIVARMTSAPQHVIVSAFEGLRDYDPSVATDGLPVPAVYIAADELQPRSDMSRFHELAPLVLYGKTVGSGHFCQLEVPQQVNAMIDRFISITTPDTTRKST